MQRLLGTAGSYFTESSKAFSEDNKEGIGMLEAVTEKHETNNMQLDEKYHLLTRQSIEDHIRRPRDLV